MKNTKVISRYDNLNKKKQFDIIKSVSPETDIYFNGWSEDGYYC